MRSESNVGCRCLSKWELLCLLDFFFLRIIKKLPTCQINLFHRRAGYLKALGPILPLKTQGTAGNPASWEHSDLVG